jgi:hypothetical protein
LQIDYVLFPYRSNARSLKEHVEMSHSKYFQLSAEVFISLRTKSSKNVVIFLFLFLFIE